MFPYKTITSIEMGKGMTGEHVKFFASGNDVKLKWIDRDEFQRDSDKRPENYTQATPLWRQLFA